MTPDDPEPPAAAEPAPTGAAIADLVGHWPESALCMEIGRRAEALRLDPARTFAWSFVPAPPIGGQAAFPGLERLGQRLVYRIERQIEDLLRGAETIDDLDRRRLLGAATLEGRDAAAGIASALVAAFGLAPPIAPLAAAVFCLRDSPRGWPSLTARARPWRLESFPATGPETDAQA